MPREPDSTIQDLSASVSYVKKDIVYLPDEYFYLDSISKGLIYIGKTCHT